MQHFLLGLMLCAAMHNAVAQHTLKAVILTAEEKSPLAQATILWKQQNKSLIADSAGLVTMQNIATGKQTFIISYTGFKEKIVNYIFPLAGSTRVRIELEKEEEEEVVVTATRISRRIANIPTRVEVISGEELAEKANMKPGDIRMMLNESTGIQTQQTSATSFNAGIRIQGLDGRYTQLLKDGYPLYAGFAGGLSILQIPPLDLRQVEIIKGSASTLYGGGAIAGLVNLVSKTPGEKRELNFLVNGTSAGGMDLSGFYSKRNKKLGVTLLASRNSNTPYDPADIGFTAIPKFERYTFNPRLFLYGKKTSADIGITYTAENRIGGSMHYIKNDGNGFFEKNKTDRIVTQLGIAHQLNDHSTVQFKNSYSHFNRTISTMGYQFSALQQSSFSELTWNRKGKQADWVIGVNLLTDDLNDKLAGPDPSRSYHYNTAGLFMQNAWTVSDKLVLETGLRGDYVNGFGLELLPRVSAMIRVSPKLTTRIGGGFGYKTPTIFTEEAERLQFRNLIPINSALSKNERSAGGNWDINYSSSFGKLRVSINHLFFYTRLNHPLVMVNTTGGKFQLQNANGHFDTRGMETNLRFIYGDFKLFIGYTYTDANTHFNNVKAWLPLTARHRLNNVLMYEKDEKWKLGAEAYYFSPQQLTDGSRGRSYWIFGFMAERSWKKWSLFINFENFTDTRQSKSGAIYTGTTINPVFSDIYMPVEGFVMNGGIKIRL